MSVSSGSTLSDVVIYYDEKTSGTNGGASSTTGWNTRVLNTTSYSRQTPPSWSSLSSNQITLQPGTYYVYAVSRYWLPTRVITRLYDVTNAAEAIRGTSEYGLSSSVASAHSSIVGTVSPTAATTYQIEYNLTNGDANGLGLSTNFGENNIFTFIKIEKMK